MNERELIHLISGTILVVVLYIGFTVLFQQVQASVGPQWAQFDFYADHHSVSGSRINLPVITR